jgi:hypothetical protein
VPEYYIITGDTVTDTDLDLRERGASARALGKEKRAVLVGVAADGLHGVGHADEFTGRRACGAWPSAK